MPNIQIKDVPDHVHRELKRRAGAEGKSLQEYMLGELDRMAAKPTMKEIFDQIDAFANSVGRSNFTFDDSVTAIDAGREEREAELMGVIEQSRSKPVKRGRRRVGNS